MTVVIHDFEVVAEPKPPDAQQPGATSATPPATAAPVPRDIERILCRHKERHARVRAH